MPNHYNILAPRNEDIGVDHFLLGNFSGKSAFKPEDLSCLTQGFRPDLAEHSWLGSGHQGPGIENNTLYFPLIKFEFDEGNTNLVCSARFYLRQGPQMPWYILHLDEGSITLPGVRLGFHGSSRLNA